MQESLSRLQVKEFQAYRLKKDSFAGVFLWVLPNISERFFVLFAKHLCVTISAKYPLFCSLRRPLPAQTLPSTFVILNRFEKKLLIASEQLFVEGLHCYFPVNMFMWIYFFHFYFLFLRWQRLPPEMLCGTSCCQKFRKFHRKTPVLQYFLNKIARF